MGKHFSFSSVVTMISSVFLIPYLITIIFNGADTALVNRKPDMEVCLPTLVSMQISPNYEPEALKSQAIIARTNLYRHLKEGDSLFNVWSENGEQLKEYMDIFQCFTTLNQGEKYEKAVEETRGQILMYNDELKLVPYHKISGGTTRDGAETLHSSEYSYLKAVDSSVDKASPDYLNGTYVSIYQMPKKLSIKTRDSSGYVTSLAADENPLEGETFSQGMGLASSNFTIQRIGESYRFMCKGKGHGLGFSQYGGNVLAKSGKNCTEILKTYFPEMDIIFLKSE